MEPETSHFNNQHVPFVYEPLSANRDIRLLELLPGPTIAVLECITLHTSLTAVELQYTALSYVWGDEEPDTPIILNGQKGMIKMNLAAALNHLRSPTEKSTLWIDALCINQEDMFEKNIQVRLMKEIYSMASKTYIWLGDEADDSNLAMDRIAALDNNNLDSPNNILSEIELQAIANLQARPWWTRVWVIQGRHTPSISHSEAKSTNSSSVETLLSKNPVVHCGNRALPIDAFVRLDDIRRGWHRNTESWGIRSALIPGNPFSASLTDLPQDRKRIQTGDKMPSLSEWLATTGSFKATNPRDKIYALFGISLPISFAALPIDYNSSVSNVYSMTAMFLIIRYQELLFLQFDPEKRNQPDLPSWVPDFSAPYHSLLLADYAASGRNCWGRNKIFISNQFPNGFREFHSSGIVVDVITYVGENPVVPTYTGRDAEGRLKNIKERAAKTLQSVKIWEDKVGKLEIGNRVIGSKKLLQSKEEAFWRTLMADRMFGKSPSPSGPTNIFYETWLDRATVPDSHSNSDPDMPPEEIKRLYVKPFTDAAITQCSGKAFTITEKGYLGLVPNKTRVGDLVCVLEGGAVPFVLRRLHDESQAENGYEFIGESYVHGVMEGEIVEMAQESDVIVFVLK